MFEKMQRMENAVRAYRDFKGSYPTEIPYLTLYRYTENPIKMPDSRRPYLYFLIAGSMRLYTPSGIMDYVAGQYSISAIDTPFSGYALAFSEKEDFLDLSMEFTLDDVISVALEIEGDLVERILSAEVSPQSMEISDAYIREAAFRLLSMLGNGDQLAYMAGHLKREILFYALCGACGKQFLQSMIGIWQAGEIYEANRWIKQNYRQVFTVEELAARKNMSVSAFHQKFKSAVGMGPLQCQKRLRLTEARRLMLDENASVTEASAEVGYESVSQFIRDYKKMFSAPPKGDIQNLRRQMKPRA